MQRQALQCISKSGQTVSICVHLTPNARNDAITEVSPDIISIHISEPPRNNKANLALAEFIADLLPNTHRRQVSVQAGTQKSREKIVNVETEMSAEEIYTILLNASVRQPDKS